MQGPTKSSVIIDEGLQVDLRVIEEQSFGAALAYWFVVTLNYFYNIIFLHYLFESQNIRPYLPLYIKYVKENVLGIIKYMANSLYY